MKKAKRKTKKTRAVKRKRIRWSELKRLSFTNSPRCPEYVEIEGQRFWWTGIGWVEQGKARGDEPLVYDDGE